MLSQQERLQVEIDALNSRWGIIFKNLSELEQERILETRVDERLRLDHKIQKIETQKQQIEQKLDDLELQQAWLSDPDIVKKLETWKGIYAEAQKSLEKLSVEKGNFDQIGLQFHQFRGILSDVLTIADKTMTALFEHS